MHNLPASISRPLEQLLQNQTFRSNFQAYTRDGLHALYGIEEEDSYCPAYYLLALNHIVTNDFEFDIILKHLPQELHQPYLDTCRTITKQSNRFGDEYIGKQFNFNSLSLPYLTNVTWQMSIDQGRQFWRIHLHSSDKQVKTLRVQYEAMAMVVLKLGQAIQHISATTLNSLPM